MKVRSPDGRTWRVTRRWVPWRRRVRDVDAPDLPVDGLGDDPISMIVGVIALIILLPFIVIALIAAVELLLVLLLLPFAVLGRVIFGRAWHVELREGFKPYFEEQAGDWQASGLRIHSLADEVRQGHLPQRTLGG
ncbi:hypothetical protein [Nocardioides acrostichi]|uniref:Uncharacterized protein n=1 Tax=Nocardioides acrostichi TaxID=2784339 RepID=A0A930V122_9ACTN|nr:hypothetical protein [Nocardioides acrostichi]MBF4161760.1 hypothetical protein [Nocardioides acrostichi]